MSDNLYCENPQTIAEFTAAIDDLKPMAQIVKLKEDIVKNELMKKLYMKHDTPTCLHILAATNNDNAKLEAKRQKMIDNLTFGRTAQKVEKILEHIAKSTSQTIIAELKKLERQKLEKLERQEQNKILLELDLRESDADRLIEDNLTIVPGYQTSLYARNECSGIVTASRYRVALDSGYKANIPTTTTAGYTALWAALVAAGLFINYPRGETGGAGAARSTGGLPDGLTNAEQRDVLRGQLRDLSPEQEEVLYRRCRECKKGCDRT